MNAPSSVFDDSLHSFQFETLTVRAIDRDSEIWFVAIDVCKALSIGNVSQAVSRVDDDEKADLIINDVSSNCTQQSRKVIIVSESGLYRLILTSRKLEAKRFTRWVTHEVLPAIRKTGKYDINEGRQKSLPQAANHLLNSSRFLMVFDEQMKAHMEQLPQDACVISANNLAPLMEFIQHALPVKFIPEMLQAGIARLVRAEKRVV